MERLAASVASDSVPNPEVERREFRSGGAEIIDYMIQTGAQTVVGGMIWETLKRFWRRIFAQSLPYGN